MRNTRYWLLLKIAEMPKAFTYGAGILIAFALMLSALLATVWLDKSRVSGQHDKAAHIFQAIVAESTTLLQHLHTHDMLTCSNADLLHLNTHLLQSRYLREIGLMDEKRRLICSTALGELDTPFKGNYPVQTSQSGLELMNNVPLQMSDSRLEAMIVMSPPFNVAVTPFATDDIYAGADAVWLRTQDDSLSLLNANTDITTLRGLPENTGERAKKHFERQGLGYALFTNPTDLDIVLQTERQLTNIVEENGILLPALLAGSLLIAVLAVGTIAPYVIKFCHLRNRIAYLCDEAHLALVYQPIFDLSTMRPVGCEVLARLKENDKLWMPDEMIPAVQDAGLEYQFDHAVTRKAIHELATHLPASDSFFDIALNYFPKSVRPDKLVPVLTQALQDTSRTDLKVCVEITEHSLSDEVISEVRSLKAQGFQIAVDDFGTGYSNLKSVTLLDPDVLKIDRSFVYELEDASVRSSLIPEIINIARAINAQTIAEGIETLEQARLLEKAGVRYGQGYALGRPMEMTQFIAFMARYK